MQEEGANRLHRAPEAAIDSIQGTAADRLEGLAHVVLSALLVLSGIGYAAGYGASAVGACVVLWVLLATWSWHKSRV